MQFYSNEIVPGHVAIRLLPADAMQSTRVNTRKRRVATSFFDHGRMRRRRPRALRQMHRRTSH